MAYLINSFLSLDRFVQAALIGLLTPIITGVFNIGIEWLKKLGISQAISHSDASLLSPTIHLPPKRRSLFRRFLIGARIGLIASIVLAGLVKGIMALTPHGTAADIAGVWTGVFREYQKENDKEGVSSETVIIKADGKELSAIIHTQTGMLRDWHVTGALTQAKEEKLIALHYVSDDPNRPLSCGTYFLRYDEKKKSYFGYWMGFDPDLDRVVAYPYVLTKESDVNAQKQFENHLKQHQSLP